MEPERQPPSPSSAEPPTAPRGQGYLAVWTVADGKLVSGQELPVGPIYSFDFTAKGSAVVLGCGPRSRFEPVSEGLVIPLR